MEFESNSDTPVTDEERRLAAQTRAKTIQPIDPFLAPAPIETVTVSENQANINLDSEDTADQHSLVQPSNAPEDQSDRHKTVGRPVVISLIALVGTLVAVAFAITLS